MKKAILTGAIFLSSLFSLQAQSDTTLFTADEKKELDRLEMVIEPYKGVAESTREERLEYIKTLFDYRALLTDKIDLEKKADEERLQEVKDLRGMRRELDLEMRLEKVNMLLKKEMDIGFGPAKEASRDSIPTAPAPAK